MKTCTQDLRKWVLHSVMFGAISLLTFACRQPETLVDVNQPSTTDANIASEQASQNPNAAPNGQTLYQNDIYGFQFSYLPSEVTVEETIDASSVLIWLNEEYQALQSGAYEEANDMHGPANVGIAIHDNSQQLDLRKWIDQSNSFYEPSDFQDVKVADQTAIMFKSIGLYDTEDIVFANPDDSTIVSISFPQDTVGENPYRDVFEQIINSFAFIDN